MDIIYNILETLLPFDFMQYTFMKNAFIAILLVSPIFAMLGTMIVNNKMAFFSDALGHSALTGIALGTLLGISNMNISMIIFAIIEIDFCEELIVCQKLFLIVFFILVYPLY